jgi:hypothetical protein
LNNIHYFHLSDFVEVYLLRKLKTNGRNNELIPTIDFCSFILLSIFFSGDLFSTIDHVGPNETVELTVRFDNKTKKRNITIKEKEQDVSFFVMMRKARYLSQVIRTDAHI